MYNANKVRGFERQSFQNKIFDLLAKITGLIREIMGELFYAYLFEKKAFWLLALPKQMLFLTNFNKNIFSKLRALDWV